MELINPISTSLAMNQPPSSAANSAVTGLDSQDFFKLLITQLTNQDPFEPTGNDELLRQISSIREIELSTTLTDSLRSLTGQQRFTSVSTLIGQFVTGIPGPDGVVDSGLVIGIRFRETGQPMLQLANGIEMSLEQVSTIQSPVTAAQALIGRSVVGIDQRDPKDPDIVDGLVTGVAVDEMGETMLELDTGEDLRLRDLVDVS